MQYILLLRGINVGGKNKVSMAELKKQLAELNFEKITTYINSGNILFYSDKKFEEIKEDIAALFEKYYDFKILFTLLSSEDYKKDSEELPSWWKENLARKDVIFFTDECDKEEIIKDLESLELNNEIIHIGKEAVFWGKYDEKEFLKTAYHKHLIKQSYYKQITIRNGKTYEKILSMIDK